MATQTVDNMNFMRASSQRNTLFACPACGRRFSIRDIARHIDGIVNSTAVHFFNCPNCSTSMRVDVNIRFSAIVTRTNFSRGEDTLEGISEGDYHKIF